MIVAFDKGVNIEIFVDVGRSQCIHTIQSMVEMTSCYAKQNETMKK